MDDVVNIFFYTAQNFLDIEEQIRDGSPVEIERSNTYSQKKEKSSPVIRRSLVHERLCSGQNTWELIHNRVLSLLTTHSAKKHLSCVSIWSSEI
ncbi:hypothetical protein GDO86_001403 [Hymenochirus boettgeri]|uniref:Uncharacterized protein n=1 Tax=Hymenochirus boettgeri TaxID=247094 RepID=A0A8T2KFN1_9PIPI|nr:hypothetical protein GDO86_001403 [Hymenochirus boettgeri]